MNGTVRTDGAGSSARRMRNATDRRKRAQSGEEDGVKWSSVMLYPFKMGLLVFAGPYEKFVKHCERYNIRIDNDAEQLEKIKGALACTFFIDNDCAILVPSVPKGSVLAHEICHAVGYALHNRGVSETNKDNEVFAYLFEHVWSELAKDGWCKD